MKNTFSLVSTYISWSSLNLPTPRMRKKACMVYAAHTLVKRCSYSLLRFISFCYVTKEGQSQAGFSSTQTLVKGSVPTIGDQGSLAFKGADTETACSQQNDFQTAEIQDHGWVWVNAYQIQCCWTSDSCVKLMKNSTAWDL